jgi:hypothetical protein
MKAPKVHLGAVVAVVAGASAGTVSAAERMVGLVPSDGTAMLVKEFAVGAGTTITGVEFENNDPRTAFSEVALFRGPLGALEEGMPLARVVDVAEATPGLVRVTWSTAVVASEAGTYYVGALPAGGAW